MARFALSVVTRLGLLLSAAPSTATPLFGHVEPQPLEKPQPALERGPPWSREERTKLVNGDELLSADTGVSKWSDGQSKALSYNAGGNLQCDYETNTCTCSLFGEGKPTQGSYLLCQGSSSPSQRGQAHAATWGCKAGTMLQVVSHGSGNICTLKKVAPAEQAAAKAKFEEQGQVSSQHREHAWV